MKKIIQIAVSETKLTTTVVALLSDGSLWWTLLGEKEEKWVRVTLPPTAETES